jgi:hypothetical protein
MPVALLLVRLYVMLHRSILIASLILAIPTMSLARAEHASGTLYTRVSGGVVHAAVTIEIHPDRHLYHTDVGGDQDEFGERYPGKPLRVIPGGNGIEWSLPRVPDPERYVDEKLHNWANVHSGTITVYLLGRFSDPADAAKLLELVARRINRT